MRTGKKPIGKTVFSVGGAVLVLVIVVAINILVSRTTLRWDATADGLYSLSQGTRTILAELDQDVAFKVFYSRHVVNVPAQIKTFAQRMIDFLSEYEQHANGRISVEIIDPKPDSEEEEWAIKYGMKGLSLPTGEPLYLGLVAVAADQEETIPFLDPTREMRLEYDLTRMITRVMTPDRMKIGIFSSLPVFGAGATNMVMGGGRPDMEPWFFIQELGKSYDLIDIAGDADRIDPTVDLLVLFHPRNMSDTLAFAVDQFILGGGNAIVFADPLSLMDDPRLGPGGSVPKTLFEAWGITMDAGQAIADYNYATRLRDQDNQVETNPMWLSTQAGAFNTDNLITANLESMLLPVAGAIEVLPDSPVAMEPLILSSPNNQMVDAASHMMDVEILWRDFSPSGVVRNLAVHLSGRFPTAFPQGRPVVDSAAGPTESETDAAEPDRPLKEGTAASVIVVVADSDLLYDGYYLSQQNLLGYTISNIFNDNLNFLLNACEMLTGNPALIGIRSRGTVERPFTRVQALELKAQDRWLSQEQALVRQVEETNATLRLLEQQKDASQRAILSEEQEQEIARFQEEKLRINRELKTVRRNLRAEIEQLGAVVKFLNIFFIPLLIGIGGVLFAIVRRRKV
ncbi:MAG: Gldg family protein [Desulfosarcina sp.]